MKQGQRVRLLVAGAAVPLLLGGCGSEPSAPRANAAAERNATAMAAKTSATPGAATAIDDALTRLLGSLDPATADSLQGPLTAVKATLASRNDAAFAGAVAVARNALAGPLAANDDRAPDLAAIALAIDAAALTR